MYLSYVRIYNFRSIRQMELKFSRGKNVILGKNNAGKSNVIKAIDLVLGDTSPDYHKSDNITLNDFHLGETNRQILIFCELTRDDGEELDYDQIANCFAFQTVHESYLNENGLDWQTCEKEDSSETYERYLSNIGDKAADDQSFIGGKWISPKKLSRSALINEFDDIYSFGILLSARVESGRIQKNARLMFRPGKEFCWTITSRAAIRNELLTSAIIPSFRDPQSQLRLNQWSWYGKLVRNCFDPNDDDLKKAFEGVKTASNSLFEGLTRRFERPAFKQAFPDTKIAFQFNPDTNTDIYKSALIYVDDGFNSLLEKKGSGIQSSVIIELFSYYTRNFGHTSGSLLAVEEPELYLHPQARRVLSNQLDQFLEEGRNQVIISTHAPEFIAKGDKKLSIHVVRKDDHKCSVVKRAVFSDAKSKQILLKRENTEMFFADHVILVEGYEKYVLESMAEEFARSPEGKKLELATNWLDTLNCSVITVGGKGEFIKYFRKLTSLGIGCTILADFDYFLRGLSKIYTDFGVKAESDKLNALKSKIGATTDTKTIGEIAPSFHEEIRAYLKPRRAKGLFFLDGELEDCFTEKCITLLREAHQNSNKGERVVFIVSELADEKTPITDLVKKDEFFKFFTDLHEMRL
jgi:putative ATP-dependent endonuclease of the OLD family